MSKSGIIKEKSSIALGTIFCFAEEIFDVKKQRTISSISIGTDKLKLATNDIMYSKDLIDVAIFGGAL